MEDQMTAERRRPRTWSYCRESRGPLALKPGSIFEGDALATLRRFPTASMDCVITSPPYHLLRSYQAGPAEIGTELTVDDYVQRIVEVCDELARVLTPTGSLWLNLGDSYSRHLRYGSPPKSLQLAPERVLLSLSRRGWIVRNKVVWAKTNPTPASVRDRLSCTWEPVFLLVRSQHYYFDLDAIREPHRSHPVPTKINRGKSKYGGPRPDYAGPLAGSNSGLIKARAEGRAGHVKGKNPGDVFLTSTASYRGAHFATFPERLITRPLLASCPQRVCVGCNLAWKQKGPACNCQRLWRPGRVLDPFIGAGTVGVAAVRQRRDWFGVELNPDYAQLARDRIEAVRKDEIKRRKSRSA